MRCLELFGVSPVPKLLSPMNVTPSPRQAVGPGTPTSPPVLSLGSPGTEGEIDGRLLELLQAYEVSTANVPPRVRPPPAAAQAPAPVGPPSVVRLGPDSIRPVNPVPRQSRRPCPDIPGDAETRPRKRRVKHRNRKRWGYFNGRVQETTKRERFEAARK